MLIEGHVACFNENKSEWSIRNILKVLIYCPKCQECLLLVLSMLFTGAIIWASRKLVSLINHYMVCTTLMPWNIPLGQNGTPCAIFPQGRGKMVYFHIFLIFAISQEFKCIWLHFMIEYMYWHSLLPNIMTIGWIFLTWDQFFLSYAVLPRLPLYEISCQLILGNAICGISCGNSSNCYHFFSGGDMLKIIRPSVQTFLL